MAIAHVQSIANGSTGSSLTIAQTTASPVTAGDLIPLFISWGSGPGNVRVISSVADNRGTVYSQIGSDYLDSTNNQKGALYYGIAAAGAGTVTVTVTFDLATTFRHLCISEYSGNDPAPLDNFYTPTVPSLTAAGADATKTASSITPSVDNCLIYGGIQDSSNVNTITPGASPSFNERTDDTLGGGSIQTEDYVQTTATAVFGTWTCGTAGNNFQGVVAAFRPLSGAAPQVQLVMGMLGTGRI